MAGAGPARWSRRQLGAGLGLAATAAVAGCAGGTDGGTVTGGGDRPAASRGRLRHRPADSSRPRGRGRRGEFTLETADGGRAVVHVPAGDGPLRVVVLLHGAGGRPERSTGLLRSYAEEHGLLLVAPKSHAATWDVVAGGLGPDVRTIDELLGRVSADYTVAGHTIAGFSDGASYALTLGVTNGDVFDSVMAFSPGFMAPAERHGRPRLFVSHGVHDEVLPIDRCSRRLVPALQEDGYDVTYEEFDGAHEIPFAIRELALEWLGEAR